MLGLWLFSAALAASNAIAASVDDCPGYTASNVHHAPGQLNADLTLAGQACNVYGSDLPNLRLHVEYQSAQRLHVKIYDAEESVYQIPESVFPRPSGQIDAVQSDMTFTLTESPFSFAITRTSSGEVLFNTSGTALVFESQYVRLRTTLPQDPNLYGLGESTDSFRLPTTGYLHSFWNAGEPYIPERSNIYGTHNIYYDHRGKNGTHAVFLLNSNGMNVFIDKASDGTQYLEYDAQGGVLDFYFLSGATPTDVSKEYAEVAGFPALMPYWSFGYHQCRYGMIDVYELAGVVANYSTANIPLETMWTDIDYMDYRRTLSLDPARFPLDKMRQFVSTLHARQQKYIMMVDPAVANYPYTPFQDGEKSNSFMKEQNGSLYTGVVWAGPSVFPDWFAPTTQNYWTSEFGRFFSADSGVDIDGLWIDMNEASNFCDYPCPNPALYSIQNQDAPRPPPAELSPTYPIPGFPSDFQPHCVAFVTFNVQAQVNSSAEQLLLLGNAFSIGNDVPHDAPQMSPYDTSPPVWNLTVQLPANSAVTYQYTRYEYSTDGSYVYERQNRTVHTGGCNSIWKPQEVHDVLNSTVQNQTMSRVLRRTKARSARATTLVARQQPPPDTPGAMLGLPGRELINPPYMINNTQGDLSAQTIPSNLYHSNGLVEFDVHNLYGSMMSSASRVAMEARRPGERPLIITRSTFAGAGRVVGHWFGDNIATWDDYRISIRQMLEFAALFQVPMVGSDTCGFNGNTTINLCSRWAMLGAFYPFYRNHKVQGALPQEYYRWPQVAEAGRKAINTRYQLLDYLYTAMYKQNQTGTPTINPLFFLYPEDSNTFNIQNQFFYGESLLVSPVLEDNTTSVSAYFPKDIFYDFETFQKMQGSGNYVTLNDISYTQIPSHIRGGSIIPMRVSSANTTTELRKRDFKLIIAPGKNGTASGSLYLDDGNSLIQATTSEINFSYARNGDFSMSGTFDYDPGVMLESITLLGAPRGWHGHGGGSGSLTRRVNRSLQKPFRMNLLRRW